jgi:hypothetical protein
MLPGTRNKNIYGLRMGISTVFKILGHLLFKGGRGHAVWSWLKCYQMLLEKRNGIYGLRAVISTVLEIFSNFPFLGDVVDPRAI